MKCKAVINLFNSNCQYVCTISTKSTEIQVKQIHKDNKLFDCDKRIDKRTKFIRFTPSTWSFWFFLNELKVSAFYRQCVIRNVNELDGIPLVVIVQPDHEVIDREW